jgi:hypothetical protein
LKLYRTEIAERKRKEAEEQQGFEQRAAQVEVQRGLRTRFVRALERWEHAQRLRAFADETRAKLTSMSEADRERAVTWLE